MDITPAVPEGRLTVQAYGGGGFRIAGKDHAGSVLLFPQLMRPWPVTRLDQLMAHHFAPVIAAAPPVEVLLLGCGTVREPLPAALSDLLDGADIGVDVMATGPACRTFNVLVGEDRRVAAALIAIG
ncbi:MAG: MTH938/NDUFAF3 family protein [Alphaproteobacteria bacterium]|nr:MTH938/NDUFAF3 family protein [Alphaproteobacteria bacterium]MDP6517993.1 MTH938/NDUFAF3 family protein [Alphaproteobacteria bacterium]